MQLPCAAFNESQQEMVNPFRGGQRDGFCDGSPGFIEAPQIIAHAGQTEQDAFITRAQFTGLLHAQKGGRQIA